MREGFVCGAGRFGGVLESGVTVHGVGISWYSEDLWATVLEWQLAAWVCQFDVSETAIVVHLSK